eukprot:CAMPEP_0181476634 /NCGR_PEP_ID=MMETSP1110-20121109/41807_1 /TAXON_ID=174948 /ORGANISM="Symbiodinium sp., Strain CCMP421" /LENGTH=263 /DNA_ID=CAMNT_0023601921 /DNA_START=75 /DNA_END=864 /DNA_ORIENTATION=-
MALMIRSALALLAAHLATAQQQQGGGMNPFAAMGGDQMIDSICKSFPNPLCPKKAVGAKSPDCQKNPNACCPDAVRKCSDTSVDTFFGSVCPKSMGAGAKCVGSDVFSPNKVGVCMCAGMNVCRGQGDQATCGTSIGGMASSAASAASSAMPKTASVFHKFANSFSRLDEEEEFSFAEPAESELNIGGMVTLGIYGSALFLVAAVAVRTFRRMRSSVHEEGVVELLSHDEEATEECNVEGVRRLSDLSEPEVVRRQRRIGIGT